MIYKSSIPLGKSARQGPRQASLAELMRLVESTKPKKEDPLQILKDIKQGLNDKDWQDPDKYSKGFSNDQLINDAIGYKGGGQQSESEQLFGERPPAPSMPEMEQREPSRGFYNGDLTSSIIGGGGSSQSGDSGGSVFGAIGGLVDLLSPDSFSSTPSSGSFGGYSGVADFFSPKKRSAFDSVFGGR